MMRLPYCALFFATMSVAAGPVLPPGPAHSPGLRRHVGVPSIAVSPKNGRLWVTWFGGVTAGEDSNNYCVLTTSADNGKTWKEVLVYDPDGEGPLRAFDPRVWISPDGVLRWTVTVRRVPLRKDTPDKPYAGAAADASNDDLMMVELNAENEPAAPWPAPRRVARGVMLGRPIVDRAGRWLLPSSHWRTENSAAVYASTDAGTTFAHLGGATVPAGRRFADEHSILQLRDGSFRMYFRVSGGPDGCWTSESKDGCRTWSEAKPANFKSTDTRCAVSRLKSGKWLLVKNGELDFGGGRRRLTAYLSDDEGKTWKGGLRLAADTGTYPDADQAPDGTIHVVWDNDRLGVMDLNYARFTEEDVLACRGVSSVFRGNGHVCVYYPELAPDIRIRDPYVFTDVPRDRYLLVSSVYAKPKEPSDPWGNTGKGVMAYLSKDLVHFTRPQQILTLDPALGCTAVWAPEMHVWRGKWYLFATLTFPAGAWPIKPMLAPGTRPGPINPRGTWVFVSDKPMGPYRPVRNGSVTPKEWMCLDGTFYEENGKPYMVFCHEWCQTGDGRMMVAELTEDLSSFVGEPKELFRASSAGKGFHVTDGPFLYRSAKSGKLFMPWSNMGTGGYTVYLKESESGSVLGPWRDAGKLFSKDGGHGMLFRKLDGSLAFTLHQPNSPNGAERMRIFPLVDEGETLRLSMPRTVVSLSTNDRIGTVDGALYGGFVEHLGRNVYGGVYDPEDPQADEDGFRRDVIAEMKALSTPIFRYPGGCFTDFWCWEEGVGPREKRPVRIDPYWKQLEDNSFGLDEFMKWIGKVGAEPMMTFNLSNRGLIEAERMWEYLRFPGGTTLSEQRRANGRDKPYDIRYWCLGNEIYGSWEYGNRSPERYGEDAREVAKFLKNVDKDAVVILCGCEWDQKWNETVLGLAWKYTDMLSIHQGTWTPGKNYATAGDGFAKNIEAAVATIERVNARQPEAQRKHVKLSIDEYFLWDGNMGDPKTAYRKGRRILDPDYTLRDAVVMADLHITMHNHARDIGYAGIAQSVNTLAPVRTEKDGRLWRQTIYDPLRLVSKWGRGEALALQWPDDRTKAIRASAIYREKEKEIVLFVINRSADETHELVVNLNRAWMVGESQELSGDEKAKNALGDERIRARAANDVAVDGRRLSVVLKPCSWRMIVLKGK